MNFVSVFQTTTIYTSMSENVMWKMKIPMLTWCHHSTRYVASGVWWHFNKSCKLPSNTHQKLNSKLCLQLALWKKNPGIQTKNIQNIMRTKIVIKYVFWILLKRLKLPKLRKSSPCTSLSCFKDLRKISCALSDSGD